MRITNLRRRIAAALMAGGLAIPAIAVAAPLNTNLVTNPSFENVDSNTEGGYGSVLILDWQGNGFAYNYSQDYDNGGPLAGGGNYYFNGGNGDGGQPIFQDIDVSTGPSADEIAAGTAGYDVSAFFSSYLEQGDYGNVTVRFLDAGNVELQSETISDSDTTMWTSEARHGVVPPRTSRVRIESQGTPLAGAPDGYVDLVDFQIVHGIPSFLTAVIDRTSGAISIENGTGDAVEIDYYEILSDGGSLDPGGWASLESQDLPGFPAGDGSGNGWEEAGNVGPGVLSESYLEGSSIVADQTFVGLGRAFDPSVGQEDVAFNYGLTDGRLVPGAVTYVSSALLGDVNQDGLVNGLDVDPFVTVLLGGSYQVEADMNQDHLVNGLDVDPFVAAVVGGGLQAVPEPSSLILLGLGLGTLAVVTPSRRRGRH